VLNPINIEEMPKTAQAVLDRVDTLSFNSSLIREMRAISSVTRLIDEGPLDPEFYQRRGGDGQARRVEQAERRPAFLNYLFELGRVRAASFLDQHFDKVGSVSSADFGALFL
jgi:NTE family protein